MSTIDRIEQLRAEIIARRERLDAESEQRRVAHNAFIDDLRAESARRTADTQRMIAAFHECLLSVRQARESLRSE